MEAHRSIPEELLDAYTLNGEIPVFNYFFLNCSSNNKPDWSAAYLKSFTDRFTFENIRNNTHGTENYPGASLLHVNVCTKYITSVHNKHVAVIGSEKPWIEAILVNAGAKSVTTVEYNCPVCNHDIIKAITYDEFSTSSVKYDTIFSFSSLEHSGLGRYGDPLNPNGDIETMQHIYSALNDGGFCFLGVPVGADWLVWNAHRVYGEKRLKLMYLDKFKEIEWFGCDKSYIYSNPPVQSTGEPSFIQPIIVLQK